MVHRTRSTSDINIRVPNQQDYRNRNRCHLRYHCRPSACPRHRPRRSIFLPCRSCFPAASHPAWSCWFPPARRRPGGAGRGTWDVGRGWTDEGDDANKARGVDDDGARRCVKMAVDSIRFASPLAGGGDGGDGTKKGETHVAPPPGPAVWPAPLQARPTGPAWR